MLKIQRVQNGIVIFGLIGRLALEEIADIKKLLASEPNHFALNLKELALVDREAVIFLAECEAEGIELKNCPAYIREWITRERGGS
ncbi:hypothetical protein H7849_15185 [Alloacidobacterium dinghuense]|uniref:STAS domain-containing protein n=1 Tax=Alloacidobacterium dinghuense TaxID=2763107 RepID=A0A7G8BD70_9BACT|nr:hypothetical protein [Alloacidobacterium dinghuense]QNI30490.1 hypothetical protein H7849_15185 [Alloacidobacterium dinghuense]